MMMYDALLEVIGRLKRDIEGAIQRRVGDKRVRLKRRYDYVIVSAIYLGKYFLCGWICPKYCRWTVLMQIMLLRIRLEK